MVWLSQFHSLSFWQEGRNFLWYMTGRAFTHLFVFLLPIWSILLSAFLISCKSFLKWMINRSILEIIGWLLDRRAFTHNGFMFLKRNGFASWIFASLPLMHLSLYSILKKDHTRIIWRKFHDKKPYSSLSLTFWRSGF